jgi:hypothetical protein
MNAPVRRPQESRSAAIAGDAALDIIMFVTSTF